jgi:acyl dehydratase
MARFKTVHDLIGAEGTGLGNGDWLVVDQRRIDAFAAVTGDTQWIHVDAGRAAAGPFGGTIAHGYLTLSLVVALTEGLLSFESPVTQINYGLDRVRFLQPVPSGSRIRAGAELRHVRPGPTGMRIEVHVEVEIQGFDSPALVADTITLLVEGDGQLSMGRQSAR